MGDNSTDFGGGEQSEAWKKAREALEKVMKPQQPQQQHQQQSGGEYYTGQNQQPGMLSWMNNLNMPVAGAPSGPQGGFVIGGPLQNQFGGGFHPSTWNQQHVNYNQQQFNYNLMQPHQQQQWAGKGRGRGQQKNNQNNWNQKNNQQQPQQQQNNRFQPFTLNKTNNTAAIPHLTNSFIPQGNGNMSNGRGRGMQSQMGTAAAGGGGIPATPPSVQRYMERSFESANTAEDRMKVQDYLQKRLHPMLSAGTAHTVNWDNEPLPHERNYELPTLWTPANKLAYAANGFARKKSPPRRQSDEYGSTKKRGRRDSEESSSSNDIFEIMSSGASKKKKTKSEKKADKKARKLEKQQQKQNQWRFEYDDSQSKREEKSKTICRNYSVFKTFIKGLCLEVEKSYFRLTAAPDPTVVRPLHILRLALDNVKNKYREKCEYRYLSSQLRSIRQDLTVQRIRTDFTIQVYEINARISLENKDREEFNQCQSQLKLLYSEVGGHCEHQAEFVSYRLLYYIAMENLIDINSLLQELTPELEEAECIQFALKVRKAVAMGNYVQFFKLFENAPKMCPFIMDLFVDRERKRALNSINKAYRPNLSYAKIAHFLSMSEEELIEWLVEELSITDAEIGGSLDCKIQRNFV
ncbi:unnamed protein product [Caenorhabditis angaria]|uniref:PCI domain-containing protein n=1 Tax=Caenorhabditis angaria TaxID=860376 RepID=A0A9P1MZZ2_9PELO|nr:unnamed protein product [Caenorhabditis angaria]